MVPPLHLVKPRPNMAVGRYKSASHTYITGRGHTNLIVLERIGRLTKGCTRPTLRRHAV